MLAVGGRSGAPLSKRAGQWLIGIEVALALVLMTGAGLILRSFARLVSVDLGFNAANVLTLEVEPLDQNAAVRRDYYACARRCAAASCRRSTSAGAIDQLALTGGGVVLPPPRRIRARSSTARQRTVLPGYFEAMGVRAARGPAPGGRRSRDRRGRPDQRRSRRSSTSAATRSATRSGREAGTRASCASSASCPTCGTAVRRGASVRSSTCCPIRMISTRRSLQLAMVMRLEDGASLPIERLKQIGRVGRPARARRPGQTRGGV